MNPIVLIPVRLAASRLPNKPIADIAGKPMISWVVEQALAANIGPVVVAGCSDIIGEAIKAYENVHFVLTDPDLPSGTDRIYAALQKFDPSCKHDVVINLQGDLPNINPTVLNYVLNPLRDKEVDITTLVSFITDSDDINNYNIVKVAMDVDMEVGDSNRVLYFSRVAIPANTQRYYHHIGVYAFCRTALERMVNLPPSPLEKLERLEQLRALEAGMNIQAVVVSDTPISIDAPDDLEKARILLASST